MPELPEVETIVRTYRPRLEGRRIVRLRSRWAKQAQPSLAAVRRGLEGQTIRKLHRRAKYIVFDLDHGHLLIHLRMSGRFVWSEELPAEPDHVRTIFELDHNTRLWFCDARKFGTLRYTTDLAAATTHLGDEPLSRRFTAARLRTLLTNRARQLKPLLLDQSVIAGLGNIYTDEALFRARLHPLARSSELSTAQTVLLHNSIRNVLREAIKRHGTSLDWIYPDGWMQNHLRVYGRTNQPCRTCRTPIAGLRVGQRGTHICPNCQPAPSYIQQPPSRPKRK